MNNGFLEIIREYLWNAELLLLVLKQDKNPGCLQFFKQLNFSNDAPEIK